MKLIKNYSSKGILPDEKGSSVKFLENICLPRGNFSGRWTHAWHCR